MTSYPIPSCQRHEEKKQASPGSRKTREEMFGLLRPFVFGQRSKPRDRSCRPWDFLQVSRRLAGKHSLVFPSENLPQPFQDRPCQKCILRAGSFLQTEFRFFKRIGWHSFVELNWDFSVHFFLRIKECVSYGSAYLTQDLFWGGEWLMETGFTFCSDKYHLFLGKTLRGKGGRG